MFQTEQIGEIEIKHIPFQLFPESCCIFSEFLKHFYKKIQQILTNNCKKLIAKSKYEIALLATIIFTKSENW